MSLPAAYMIDGDKGNDPREPSQHDTRAGTITNPKFDHTDAVGAIHDHDGVVASPTSKQSDIIRASHHHDKSITFEEYMYYAEITRAEEHAEDERYRSGRGPTTLKTLMKDRFSKGRHSHSGSPSPQTGDAISQEKRPEGDGIITGVSDAEWKQASRAVRTAGWGGVFYLITTDILGPFSTPWAFAQMGYGPGIALYTVFGIMSFYSGWLVWKVFLGLDSDRYPLRGYGDLFFRTFGALSRHLINFAQGLQLLLFVAVLILSNGQSISQISQGPSGGAGLCFVVCLVIFMAAGFVLGQIRTLQRFSWVANISVYLNLLIIFIV
jgi:hypothetical protein